MGGEQEDSWVPQLQERTGVQQAWHKGWRETGSQDTWIPAGAPRLMQTL